MQTAYNFPFTLHLKINEAVLVKYNLTNLIQLLLLHSSSTFSVVVVVVVRVASSNRVDKLLSQRFTVMFVEL